MESIGLKQRISTRDLVETALLTAMVLVATKFINIRLPIAANGGLVHMGTAMLIISSIVFGSKKGALSGAFGMALFDIMSGWALWAPFTFVVRGVMGYLLGRISDINGKKGHSVGLNILAVIISTAWMIFGYYITEGILYGNWIAPMTSIPGNLMQSVIGLMVAIPIIKAVEKTLLGIRR